MRKSYIYRCPKQNYTYVQNSTRCHRGAGAQAYDSNVIVAGFILTQGIELIFSFSHSGIKAKACRCVHHLTHASKIL